MANIKDEQVKVVRSSNTEVLINSGGHGSFFCDASIPFDFSAAGPMQGRRGFAVKFFNDGAGNGPVISTIGTNGVHGFALDGTSWDAGTGFAIEIESLIMATGRAMILLKKD